MHMGSGSRTWKVSLDQHESQAASVFRNVFQVRKVSRKFPGKYFFYDRVILISATDIMAAHVKRNAYFAYFW